MEALTPEQQTVVAYFSRLPTIIGYQLVMGQNRHFGYYDDTHTTERTAQARFLEKVDGLLDMPAGPDVSVLDAGCGQGLVGMHVAETSEAHVTGITLVPFEVRSAQRRAQRRGLADRTTFVQGDYTRPPFEPDSFDRVLAIETLSHVPEVKLATGALFGLLKPGGKLLAIEYECDYANADPKDLEDAKFLTEHAGLFGANQFTPGQFRTTLEANGFANITEEDWTAHMLPSFQRLRRLARPLQPLIWLFGNRPSLVNTIAASKYADWTEKGIFALKAYTATKPEES